MAHVLVIDDEPDIRMFVASGQKMALNTKRLRWLMCGLIVVDHALTLAGQPKSYWKQPETAQEFNNLGAWVMRHGPIAAIIGVAIYIALACALVTYLKGKLAEIVLMMFVLGHFTASAGWLMYRYGWGVSGLYVYGFAVGAVFVYYSRPLQSGQS